MLTSSSNQYLRPEYLTPLPTTLDAKKSPLALLAQTCSQIGADPLPTGGSKSSLLNSSSSSSNHDGGSTLGGSSSTPLSSSSNPSSSGSTSSSSSSYKKSKSSHHLNVGTEHPPPSSKHRTSSGSAGGADGKKSKSFKSSHQSSGNSEKTGSSKEGRLTPPLVRNNSDSNCSSGSGSSSGRAKSASPEQHQDKRKTPLSTAGDKSPSVTTADNKSVVSNNNNVDVGIGSISASTGNPIPVTGNSSTTANAGAADSVLSKVETSHPSSSSVAASSAPQTPVFSSAPLTNGSGLGGKLNLNGPLGDLTSAELFSLSSLKSHGAAGLPFPPFYPGLAGLGAASAGGAPATANLPPYLHSYARLKAAAAAAAAASAANGGATDHLTANGTGGKPGGGHGHVNCRDPFCTSCQLGAGHLGASALPPGAKPPCPAGCIQCDHHNNPFTPSSFPFLPRLPLPPSFYSSALANSASSAAAASANSAQPYVCNWIVGETYCGKRFASSDELLQHLRSHTSLSSAAASSGQSSEHLMPYAHNPFLSLMSMNMGRSPYPSPASLNHLSSARYHPYSKLGSLAGLSSGPPSMGGLGGGPSGGSAAEVAAAAAAAAGLLNFQSSPSGFPSLGHHPNPYFPYAAFYGPR